MSPPSKPLSASADDPDKTILVEGPTPSALLHENVGRLLGEMLNSGLSGVEQEGDHIGPYRLCELLGQGGFGNVWRAEQTKPVRREVAVKVIKLGMDTMQVLTRFDQERQALASMDHPCIASMIDAGVAPDGRPYFAMELVRGETLIRWCEQQRLPLKERLRLFIQVCQAVQHAHQKGIIHRDLKPSNILVTEIDGQPTPKVIDFGIAKAMHTEVVADYTMLTHADQVLGTPRYMSPEQIDGESLIDTRSDIYSLGVLLYELLTGSLPFDATANVEEMKRLVRASAPPRPSTQIRKRSKAQKPSLVDRFDDSLVGYSADLDWITLRALERDCDRRYQTAAEFAADVQHFLDCEPVLACPPSFGYVTSRWIKRNRTLSIAAAILLLQMIVGTAVALRQAQLARAAQHSAESEAVLAHQAEKRAEQAKLQAEKSGQQAQQTATFVTGLLERMSQEINNGLNPEALKAALASSDQEILKLSTDPELRISLLNRIEGIYSTIDEAKLAIPLAKAKAEEIGRLHGPESEAARAAELSYLKMVTDFGERSTAPALLENLQRRVEADGGIGGKFWLEVQRLVSRAWMKLDLPEQALAAAEKLMAEAQIRVKRGKMSQAGMVLHQIAYASALEFAGKYDEALALLAEARRYSEDTAHTARIEDSVITLLQRKGDFKRGAELQRTKLAKQETRLGIQSRELIPVLILLADLESHAGEHVNAIAHSERALALAREQTATNESSVQTQRKEVWQALLALADREDSDRRHGAAIAHAQEALQLAEEMGNERLITRTLRDLSDFNHTAGNLEAAYNIKHQSYQRIRSFGANRRDGELELREMCDIRLEQNRAAEGLKIGIDLWAEIQTRPESKEDVAHLGEVAASILDCYAALKAAQPTTPEPQGLAEWQAALEQYKRLNLPPK